VKSLDMARKLNRIAENMKEPETEGTTRIDWHCLTERERLLFDKMHAWDKETSIPPSNTSNSSACHRRKSSSARSLKTVTKQQS